MDLKLFDLRQWGEWAARTVIVGGIVFWGLFFLMQWEGIEVNINLPAVQRAAKK